MMCNFLLQGKVETSTGEYMVTPLPITDLPSALSAGGSVDFPDKTSENSSVDGSSAGGSSSHISNLGPSKSRLLEKRAVTLLSTLVPSESGRNAIRCVLQSLQVAWCVFDLQQRTGTAFMLSDSLAAGIVGLIGVGSGEDGSKTAMKTIHKALRFIESQVGSMRLQGESDSEKSNFPEISATIKALVQSFEPGKAEGKKSGH